ncbi:hypothetical protein ACH0BF_20480 [Pseudobacillus sp. 179-B 2D1 NHS]|uniref:hypothetical protein n=1 Tax=Pseudobacillus sp. 179-B 2D1 NHS TaxID=3374292 RepID=UPI00387A0829
MKFYIKTDKNNIVRDVLTYSYEGFEEIEYDDHVLPRNILSGYYKWDAANNDFIVDEQLKKEIIRENGGYVQEEVDQLKQKNAELETSLLEMTVLAAEQEQRNIQNEQAIMELTTIIAGGNA